MNPCSLKTQLVAVRCLIPGDDPHYQPVLQFLDTINTELTEQKSKPHIESPPCSVEPKPLLPSDLREHPKRPIVGKKPPPKAAKQPGIKSEKSVQPKCRSIGWEILPTEKIPNSLWNNIDMEKSTLVPKFEDVDTIFDMKPKSADANTRKSGSTVQAKLISVIEPPSRAQNVEIALRRSRLLKAEADVLSIARNLGLDPVFQLIEEELGVLQSVYPTDKKEISKLRDLAANPPLNRQIAPSNLLLILLLSIPRFPQRLAATQARLNFDDLCQVFDNRVELARDVAEKLLVSLNPGGVLRIILKFLLDVMNYVNRKAGLDPAKGFAVSAISSLSDLRDFSRRVSLLKVLVDHIDEQQPDTWSELAWMNACPVLLKCKMSFVDDISQQIRENLAVVQSEVKASARDQDFISGIGDLITMMESKFDSVTSAKEKFKERIDLLAARLGAENPTHCFEVIRSIDAFWKGVKNARMNIQRELVVSAADNHQKLVSSTSASEIPRQNTPDSEDSGGPMSSDTRDSGTYISEVSRLPAKNPRQRRPVMSQVLPTSSYERTPVKAKICAASSGVSLGRQVMGLGILGSRKWDMPVATA